MSTKEIGNIGEAITLAEFTRFHIPVYIPFGDNEKADLIAEFNEKLQKIQVKTSQKFDGKKMFFNLSSSSCHRRLGGKKAYTSDEVDYFALYNIEANILLLIPQERVNGLKAVSFQMKWKPSRNQYQCLNWQDFIFDDMVNQ